jgi:hypothetical protein
MLLTNNLKTINTINTIKNMNELTKLFEMITKNKDLLLTICNINIRLDLYQNYMEDYNNVLNYFNEITNNEYFIKNEINIYSTENKTNIYIDILKRNNMKLLNVINSISNLAQK